MLSGAFFALVSSFSRVKGIFFSSKRIGLTTAAVGNPGAACTRTMAAPATSRSSRAGRAKRDKNMLIATIAGRNRLCHRIPRQASEAIRRIGAVGGVPATRKGWLAPPLPLPAADSRTDPEPVTVLLEEVPRREGHQTLTGGELRLAGHVVVIVRGAQLRSKLQLQIVHATQTELRVRVIDEVLSLNAKFHSLALANREALEDREVVVEVTRSMHIRVFHRPGHSDRGWRREAVRIDSLSRMQVRARIAGHQRMHLDVRRIPEPAAGIDLARGQSVRFVELHCVV